jgi:hypothetical protein
MDPAHVHAKLLPDFGSKAQTSGAELADFVEGDEHYKMLVVGTRGIGAVKRCEASNLTLGILIGPFAALGYRELQAGLHANPAMSGW